MSNIPEYKLSGADEDEIYRVKTFVTELSKIQNSYFENLSDKLKIDSDEDGDWLFDYIFNDVSDLSFVEYLENYKK